MRDLTEKGFWTFPKMIFAGTIALVVVTFLLLNVNIIESGEVGIKKVSGKYEKEPMTAGIYWTPPWVSVEIIDAHMHSINYIISAWDDKRLIDHDMQDGVMTVSSIKATDSRGLPIDVDITVRYQINQEVVPATIAEYGRGWEEMLVNPIVRDSVREVIARYPAEEIPIKRADIGAKIEQRLAKKVEAIKNTPLFFAGSNLREVRLPKKINDNITRVQEARQAKERAIQETELAKQNALKVVAIAKGEADKKKVAVDMEAYARVTRAKAEADSIKLRAEAQAEANRKIANSLTPQLVELKNIEAKIELYRNPSLKIVPDNSNMLFGDIFGKKTDAKK